MPAALYSPHLEEVQISQEAAWGDAAAPTIGLAGITSCKMTPKIETAQIPDKRASTMPAYIASVNRISGEVEMSGIVTYTQVQYLLNAMFAVDAATPFAYIAALAPAAPTTNNIMWGQANLSYGMAGAVMDKLTIHGDTNGPLTYDAHWFGKAPVALARVALTPPAVIAALGGQTKLYIDPIATAHGTTELTLTAFSFDFEMLNSRSPVWHLGTLNPDNYKHGKWGGSLKLVVEMTAATKAYLTAILAATVEPVGYNIRLMAAGGGTTNLTMDFSGHLLEAPLMFTDQDGVTTSEMTFSPAYSAQAGMLSCFKFSNVAS
jgi:hypothetical protein